MAKGVIILYEDQYEPVSQFTDAQLGQLFRGIFKFHQGDDVSFTDPMLSVAFAFFKSSFIRHQKEYEEIRAKRAEAGRKGRNSVSKQMLANASNCYLQQEQEQEQENISASSFSNEKDSAVVDASETRLDEKCPFDPIPENPKATLKRCPYHKIIELYHKHLPMLQQVFVEVFDSNETRKAAVRSRWAFLCEVQKCKSVEDGLAEFDAYFRLVARSDFLTGKSSAWRANFDWLMNKSNFGKVLEGHYDNRK